MATVRSVHGSAHVLRFRAVTMAVMLSLAAGCKRTSTEANQPQAPSVTTTPQASSTHELDVATAQLVGSGDRQWVRTAWIAILGPDPDQPTCKAGEYWTFGKDDLLTIRECKDGKSVVSNARWKASITKDGDVMVAIDRDAEKHEYYLLFRTEKTSTTASPVALLRERRESQPGSVDELHLTLRDD